MLSEFEIGELVPGTSYRVISCIGQGGMGSVYEVEHRELGKRFVVKALLREFVGRVDLVQRLRNEWRALGSLEHPHIVSVSDAGVSSNGVPYYVMERLNGETLADRIKRQGRLEPAEALRIAVEILDALTAAHAIGVVHRDIKPPNIFLTRSGASKILDFGIAKLLDGTAAITGRGVAIGTPRYMSPEQASGERIDARADLYAVGLVLFEMLSGQSPFEGASAQEVFLAHVTKPAPSILSLVPTLPQELAGVIAKLLEKKPADRIRSAKRTAESLRQIVRSFAPAASDTEVAPFSGALTPMFGVDSSRLPPSLDAWTISENGPTQSARASAPPPLRHRAGHAEAEELSVSAVPTEVLTQGDSVPPTRTSVPAGAPVPASGSLGAPGAASPAPWGLTPMPQFRGYSPETRRAFLRWAGLGVAVVALAVFARVSWGPAGGAPSSALAANGAPAPIQAEPAQPNAASPNAGGKGPSASEPLGGPSRGPSSDPSDVELGNRGAGSAPSTNAANGRPLAGAKSSKDLRAGDAAPADPASAGAGSAGPGLIGERANGGGTNAAAQPGPRAESGPQNDQTQSPAPRSQADEVEEQRSTEVTRPSRGRPSEDSQVGRRLPSSGL